MSLAIFNGRPAFSKPQLVGVPFVEPEVRERYHKLMDEVFDRKYFTNNGPLVQRFESKIAALHNVAHCSVINNATIAQILLLKALGLKGEVILPSFTFIATAHACLWQNLDVVFCDISPDTLMIDPEKAERLITPRTCAVIGVHLFGNVCNVESLTKLCKKYGLKLIFDAAHAFNCSLGDKPVGGFGDGEFLSFHATKFLGTFEGGAVLTSDGELNEKIGYLRNFGFVDYDMVTSLGINGKMSESSAAMGLASLPMIGKRTEKLAHIHRAYRDALDGIPGIRLLPVGETGRSNYRYAVILVNQEHFGVSRDTLCLALWKENIQARRYFYPGCHQMEYYRAAHPSHADPLEVTNLVSQQVICLPTNLDNPDVDTETISTIIREVQLKAEEVNQWKEHS
jgi:dTDP-4-amino-4,6-dideoxygalactose transaminase